MKSQKVYFSTFRLFNFSTFRLFSFPLDSQRFQLKFKKSKSILFDFSTFLLPFGLSTVSVKIQKVKKYTFRLFDFPLDSQRFQLKFKKSKSILFITFRLFDFSTFLLPFGLSTVSVKIQKVKKYTFRLFFFPLDSQRFHLKFKKSESILFDFSTFLLPFGLSTVSVKIQKVKKYTFRLFDFSSSLWTLNGFS